MSFVGWEMDARPGGLVALLEADVARVTGMKELCGLMLDKRGEVARSGGFQYAGLDMTDTVVEGGATGWGEGLRAG
jgi:hypothetical protein